MNLPQQEVARPYRLVHPAGARQIPQLPLDQSLQVTYQV